MILKSDSCIWVPIRLKNEPWVLNAISELTRKHKSFADVEEEEIKWYYGQVKSHILLPRCYSVPHQIQDISTPGHSINVKSNITPRNLKQELAMNWMSENRNGLLCMQPGEGKTVVAIEAICRVGEKAIIFVHKNGLGTQWIDRIVEHTDMDANRVGWLRSSNWKADLQKQVIVATVQTFCSLIKTKGIEFVREVRNAKFGMAIWDECIDGEHPVYTKNESIKLKNLKIGEYIRNNKNEYIRVNAIRITEKESVKITLKSGKTFIMSSDHPVLTKYYSKNKYYYECRESSKCENFLFYMKSHHDTVQIDNEEYLIGLYYGDGHIANDGYECHKKMAFSYRKKKYEWVDKFKMLFEGIHNIEENKRGDLTIGFSKEYTKNMIEKYELQIGKKSGTFSINEKLYRKNSPGVIKGLFDSDGYLQNDSYKIGLELTSKNAILQIRDMLAYYGIRCSITCISREKPANNLYRLIIDGKNTLRFILLFGKPFKSNTVLSTRNTMNRHDNMEMDKVIKIENIGKRILYDISIDSNDELFVCDGYVMHNCHTSISAEQFSKTSLYTPAYRYFGLSATPDRTDGNTDIMSMHLGDTFIPEGEAETMTPKVIMIYIDHGIMKKYKFRINQLYLKEGNKNRGRFSKGTYLKWMWKSEKFMNMLNEIVRQIDTSGRFALILSERINVLETARKVVKHQKRDSSLYVGSMSDADQIDMLMKRIIFSTYLKARDGLDIPRLDSIVFCSPVSNIDQAVGRVVRTCDNKRMPVVIDIVDTGCEEMKDRSKYRRKFYDEKGWHVEEKILS